MRVTKADAWIEIQDLEKRFGFDRMKGTVQLDRIVREFVKREGADIELAKIEVYSAYGELRVYEKIACE